MAKKGVTPKTGFNKEFKTSEALEAIVGKKLISRPQMTKKLWEYIRANSLQDSVKRRFINPDEKLGKVLGTKPIDMFQMTKKLKSHLTAA